MTESGNIDSCLFESNTSVRIERGGKIGSTSNGLCVVSYPLTTFTFEISQDYNGAIRLYDVAQFNVKGSTFDRNVATVSLSRNESSSHGVMFFHIPWQ